MNEVNATLSSMSEALDTVVHMLKHPNETAAREKWRQAQEAWLDQRFDRAVELYEESLEIYDALSPSSFQLGNLYYFKLHNIPKAKEAFNLTIATATRRFPSLAAMAHYTMYRIHIDEGMGEAAWDAVVNATTLDRALGPAWYDRARLAAILDKKDPEIINSLETVIAIDSLYYHRARSDATWDKSHHVVTTILDRIYNECLSSYNSAVKSARERFSRALSAIGPLKDDHRTPSSITIENGERILSQLEKNIHIDNLPELLDGITAVTNTAISSVESATTQLALAEEQFISEAPDEMPGWVKVAAILASPIVGLIVVFISALIVPSWRDAPVLYLFWIGVISGPLLAIMLIIPISRFDSAQIRYKYSLNDAIRTLRVIQCR